MTKTHKADRYFEDFHPGARFECGSIDVEEAEVLSFARRFDPQPIHADPDFAARGPFNGLIASGWHTAALMMRLFVDGYLPVSSSLVSPGLRELRWLVPVRPGDRLRLSVEVREAIPSKSRPDRGIIRSYAEAVNQNDLIVASFIADTFILRRGAAAGMDGA